MTDPHRILTNAGQNMDALLDEVLNDPHGEGLMQTYVNQHTLSGPVLSDMVA